MYAKEEFDIQVDDTNAVSKPVVIAAMLRGVVHIAGK